MVEQVRDLADELGPFARHAASAVSTASSPTFWAHLGKPLSSRSGCRRRPASTRARSATMRSRSARVTRASLMVVPDMRASRWEGLIRQVTGCRCFKASAAARTRRLGQRGVGLGFRVSSRTGRPACASRSLGLLHGECAEVEDGRRQHGRGAAFADALHQWSSAPTPPRRSPHVHGVGDRRVSALSKPMPVPSRSMEVSSSSPAPRSTTSRAYLHHVDAGGLAGRG